MKKAITMLAILAVILGLIAGASFFILKKQTSDVREQELKALEANSEPVNTTVEERGNELKTLEQNSEKPAASAEARTSELSPVLE